jgi:hypothetical protein
VRVRSRRYLVEGVAPGKDPGDQTLLVGSANIDTDDFLGSQEQRGFVRVQARLTRCSIGVVIGVSTAR